MEGELECSGCSCQLSPAWLYPSHKILTRSFQKVSLQFSDERRSSGRRIEAKLAYWGKWGVALAIFNQSPGFLLSPPSEVNDVNRSRIPLGFCRVNQLVSLPPAHLTPIPATTDTEPSLFSNLSPFPPPLCLLAYENV